MTHLSISLLGWPKMTMDGCNIFAGNSKKSQALLAYLAEYPGNPQPRSKLAGLLWPEHSEQSAFNSLRQVLFKLQHDIQSPGSLFPFLLADHESITFNPHSDCSIDSLEFNQLVNKATSLNISAVDASLFMEQAVRLYRGEFLDTFSLEDCSSFDDWMISRREIYRSLVLEALNRLVKFALLNGNTNLVKTYARRQMEIEPCLEDAHYALMRALAFEGKRYDALVEYHSYRVLLKKELDEEPSPKTIQLYEHIREGDLSSEQVTWAGLAD